MAPASIKLSVPGTLRYRPIAVRVVAEAARLVSGSPGLKPDRAADGPDNDHDHGVHDDHFADSIDVRDPFDTAVVSAFMEIFNNVAIHAYKRRETGTIDLVITPGERELVIEIKDQGAAFDIDNVAELPEELDADSLPEGGMGIHIAKTMLDEMTYEPGPPNLWRLCKRLPAIAHGVGSRRS